MVREYPTANSSVFDTMSEDEYSKLLCGTLFRNESGPVYYQCGCGAEARAKVLVGMWFCERTDVYLKDSDL